MKQDEKKDSQKKRFNLYNLFYKDGKGVEKDEIKALEDPGIVNFFKLYFRKVGKLIPVNALYVFGNFPILFLIFAYAGYTSLHTTVPYYQIFVPLSGAMNFGDSPVISALMGMYGYQVSYAVPTTLTYVLIGLTALLFVTFGPVNVGTTYIIRNMVREEPVFIWSDFWYAIKKNLRQGLIMGAVDLFLCIMLVYDIIYFSANAGSFQMDVLYFLSYAMIIFYFFMRLYLYLMMITFDLSIIKLIKNSVFFAILGIKRNIMALIGVAICVAFVYLLMNVFMPLGIILPFFLLFSTGSFIGAYCAYPKIKEIMIDPYYTETKVSDNEDIEA